MLAMLLDDNTAFIVTRFMTYETQVSELVGERSEVPWISSKYCRNNELCASH